MIEFNEEKMIFKLDTPATSYIFRIADGRYPVHVYYGRRLSGMDAAAMPSSTLPKEPSVNPAEKLGFLDRAPMEFAAGGTGDLRESCIRTVDGDGRSGLELLYRNYEIFEGKRPLPGLPASFAGNAGGGAAAENTEEPKAGEDAGAAGDSGHASAEISEGAAGAGRCRTLEVTLEDESAGVRVVVSYSVFDDVDVIMRSARVTNIGDDAIFVEKMLSACLPLPQREYDVLSLYGAWAREHMVQRHSLPYGAYVTESIRGEPGHESQPFLAALSRDATETGGDVYAMALVYSGNFLAKLQRGNYEWNRMVMGIHPENFRWKLAGGETFQAPEAALTYSAEGIGKMSRNFHDFIRGHIIRSPWQYRKRPVLINNWEATYFAFDSAKLLTIAEKAASVGIDLFVMDDGWFGDHRDEPSSGLGDWRENPRKIPEGLPAFAEKIHGLGLRFGLWFEPEMISPDSELYRTHPDWALAVPGRTPTLCRDQYVLDFSNSAVRDYLYETMAATIRLAKIDYLKWDMNRPLAELYSAYLPADRQGELSHRHVLGVYEIEERLLAEFPELLLENCSSGGARFDMGMLYYSPQIWCSDDMDPIARLEIEEGTGLVFPVSSMGAHVCKAPNDITGRDVPLATRANLAMLGTFGYELDITELDEEGLRAIPEQIKKYESLRQLIQNGDLHRLASYRENGEYECLEVVSKDRRRAVVVYVQGLARPNSIDRVVRLRGLDADAVYDVNGARFGGDTLMYMGYSFPWRKEDFCSVMLELFKVEGEPAGAGA